MMSSIIKILKKMLEKESIQINLYTYNKYILMEEYRIV